MKGSVLSAATMTVMATVLLVLPSSVKAFAPASTSGINTRSTCTTDLKVFPSPADFGAGDFTALHHLAHDFAASSSMVLSDAAGGATVDAAGVATAVSEDGGWWQNYLQIFRNILVFVHDTVDGPLKSVGVENTWGISIALFTCSIRATLVPLSIQQNKNSEYMKALKPYMNEIKEKFKDNEQARNAATGKLFEDANQNPLAGCIVSLVQLPVLLGLYRGIRILAMEGQLQEPFLWIPSLEGPVSAPTFRGTEWLTEGWTTDAISGYPVPGMGWETTLAFLAMPALLILLQTFTLNALQPPVDENMSEEEAKTFETTQLVFKFLPLMLGFFALQVPAGLTIYWVTTNLFTLTQSLAVRAYFAANPPDINLPDYWDTLTNEKDIDDMTPDERRQAVQAGLSVGPTMEDLKIESKFHNFVARQPLRSNSAAWQKLESSEIITIPAEMATWVSGDDQKQLQESATAAMNAEGAEKNNAPAAATATS